MTHWPPSRLPFGLHEAMQPFITDRSASPPDARDVAALYKALESVPPEEVLDIASRLRSPTAGIDLRSSPVMKRRWFGLGKPTFEFQHLHLRWLKNSQTAPLLLIHYSGRVREDALRRLVDLPPSPFFLVVLAARLNDWVPQVRIAARAIIDRLSDRIPAAVIAECAPILLVRARTWTRWSDDERQRIDRLYRRTDVIEATVASLVSADCRAPASTLRYALRLSEFDPYLPELAAHAVSPSVRALALKAIGREMTEWPIGPRPRGSAPYSRLPRFLYDARRVTVTGDRIAFIEAGLADRSPIVRRAAADVVIQQKADLAALRSAIENLRGDAFPSIRQRAEYLLQ